MSASAITAYEIGVMYDVPCIFWKYLERWSWWPVLGPMHEDAKIIGFRWDHYHIDHRFLTVGQFSISARYVRRRDAAAAFRYPLHQMHEEKNLHSVGWPQLPTIKRKRCLREWPSYPGTQAPWMQKLENAYECARMKKGLCPHQGAPLAGLEVKDGVVTCPLHGLRWDVETGAMVRRTTTTRGLQT